MASVKSGASVQRKINLLKILKQRLQHTDSLSKICLYIDSYYFYVYMFFLHGDIVCLLDRNLRDIDFVMFMSVIWSPFTDQQHVKEAQVR